MHEVKLQTEGHRDDFKQHRSAPGQFVEIPEAVVFTVEYSVCRAMKAVNHHCDVDLPIPPIYHGLAGFNVARSALRTALA